MKKLFYKILYRMIWLRDWTKVRALQLFYWSPWGRAYICLALEKYLQSDWYKERSSMFVKRRAFEMYFDHDESWFFKRRITRKEKLGIAFMPYSYLKKTVSVVDECGLMDYV